MIGAAFIAGLLISCSAYGSWAPNGKIYGIPNSAAGVLIIDPHSKGEVFKSVTECAYFNKF
jgi:hypothetical protein